MYVIRLRIIPFCRCARLVSAFVGGPPFSLVERREPHLGNAEQTKVQIGILSGGGYCGV